MDHNRYLAFVVATAIMILTPGPSVLLTVANSISFGWRSGLVTVAGATVGIAVQLVAVVGLGSLLYAVVGGFERLRWAGAAYLVYLGIKQWQSGSVPLDLDVPVGSKGALLMQGLLITMANPKSLIFVAAFLPQFIDVERPLSPQMAVIAPTFLAITFGVTALWAIGAGKARELLRSPRASRVLLRGAGAFTILAGVGLALAR